MIPESRDKETEQAAEPRSARSAAKRALDVFGAIAGGLVTLPLSALAAGAILLSMGPPVLFRQRRAGYLGRPFTLHKFRTMRGESVPGREGLDDGERLTGVGRLLRRTSIDELPQLLDVLAGKMSLVGPRPLLMEYLPLYSKTQWRRHEAKPGITGWTQVNGRNALSWDAKFELDVWYVDNWSFLLDLKILLLTVRQVLEGRGITAQSSETTTRFLGNPEHGGNRRGASAGGE